MQNTKKAIASLILGSIGLSLPVLPEFFHNFIGDNNNKFIALLFVLFILAIGISGTILGIMGIKSDKKVFAIFGLILSAIVFSFALLLSAAVFLFWNGMP